MWVRDRAEPALENLRGGGEGLNTMGVRSWGGVWDGVRPGVPGGLILVIREPSQLDGQPAGLEGFTTESSVSSPWSLVRSLISASRDLLISSATDLSRLRCLLEVVVLDITEDIRWGASAWLSSSRACPHQV